MELITNAAKSGDVATIVELVKAGVVLNGNAGRAPLRPVIT